jgi:hypothetical protein
LQLLPPLQLLWIVASPAHRQCVIALQQTTFTRRKLCHLKTHVCHLTMQPLFPGGKTMFLGANLKPVLHAFGGCKCRARD